MKERQSVKVANWSKKREEFYKIECDEILYRIKSEIILDDDNVYTLTDSQKKILVKIDDPKKEWFQIWLKLREYL